MKGREKSNEQPVCKPGSVHVSPCGEPMGQSFIYAPRHRDALSSYPPMERVCKCLCASRSSSRARDGSPRAIGILGLSTSEVHAPCRHRHGRWSLTRAFSPLPSHPVGGYSIYIIYIRGTDVAEGGCFLLYCLALADYFPLRSGLPCVARTFLYPGRHVTSTSLSGMKNTHVSRQRLTVRLFIAWCKGNDLFWE